MVSLIIYIIGLIGSTIFLFGYISSSNLFPEPLNAEEEKECLERYLSGDIEARNTLIERNLRLVAHIAKKYASNSQENEEYISIGTIGLIKAINSFSNDKKTKVSTYASRCIENEILMNIRSSKKLQSETSMNMVVGTDKEGNDMSLIDVLQADTEDIVDTIDMKVKSKLLRENVDNLLTQKEQDIINLRYGLRDGVCRTQQDVANRLDISRSYVSRIETKAIKKLNKVMKKE